MVIRNLFLDKCISFRRAFMDDKTSFHLNSWPRILQIHLSLVIWTFCVKKFHCYSLVCHKSVTCAKAEVTFPPPPSAFYVPKTKKNTFRRALPTHLHYLHFFRVVHTRERENTHGQSKVLSWRDLETPSEI